MIDGELITDSLLFFPVHRDSEGNFVARGPAMLSSAFQDDTRDSTSPQRVEFSTVNIESEMPNKVAYVLSTFQTFLKEQKNRHNCNVFCEFIYPTYRAAFIQSGEKETLGASLARLIEADPQLNQIFTHDNGK